MLRSGPLPGPPKGPGPYTLYRVSGPVHVPVCVCQNYFTLTLIALRCFDAQKKSCIFDRALTGLESFASASAEADKELEKRRSAEADVAPGTPSHSRPHFHSNSSHYGLDQPRSTAHSFPSSRDRVCWNIRLSWTVGRSFGWLFSRSTAARVHGRVLHSCSVSVLHMQKWLLVRICRACGQDETGEKVR